MVFSSILFLFYFLPILFLLYVITPIKFRNYILLIGSLIFYFIGEPKNIIYLVLSSIINYFIGKRLEKKKSKLLLVLGLIYNISFFSDSLLLNFQDCRRFYRKFQGSSVF